VAIIYLSPRLLSGLCGLPFPTENKLSVGFALAPGQGFSRFTPGISPGTHPIWVFLASRLGTSLFAPLRLPATGVTRCPFTPHKTKFLRGGCSDLPLPILPLGKIGSDCLAYLGFSLKFITKIGVCQI